MRVVEILEVLPHLLVGLDVGADHVVAEGDVLEEVGLGELVDDRQLHQLRVDLYHKGDLAPYPVPALNLLGLLVEVGVGGLDEQHERGRSGEVVVVELPVLGDEVLEEPLAVLDLEVELVVGDLDLSPFLVGVVVLQVLL